MSAPEQDSHNYDQAFKEESDGEEGDQSNTYVPSAAPEHYHNQLYQWHLAYPQGTVLPQNQLSQGHDDNTFLRPPSQDHTDHNAFANEALDPYTHNYNPIPLPPPAVPSERNPWLIRPPSDKPPTSFGMYGVSDPLWHDNSAQGSVPPRSMNRRGNARARRATIAPTAQVARPLTTTDDQLRPYQGAATAAPPLYNQGLGTWQPAAYVQDQDQYPPHSDPSTTAYQYPPATNNDTYQDSYPSQ